jgi:hypothetical protein
MWALVDLEYEYKHTVENELKLNYYATCIIMLSDSAKFDAELYDTVIIKMCWRWFLNIGAGEKDLLFQYFQVNRCAFVC